jgi:phage-related protein
MDAKPLVWIGSSREDLKKFPEEVQDVAGFGLHKAQMGSKHPAAKPLKGYHGAGVVEIIDNYSGNTYRIIYTTKLEGVIYVLHAFQKKAKTGIETPKQEIVLINSRLRIAIEHHKLRFKK